MGSMPGPSRPGWGPAGSYDFQFEVAAGQVGITVLPRVNGLRFTIKWQDGTEQAAAYAGELQYFKQGAYNQTNGKDPAGNLVWSTGAETYGGDLSTQYANGSFTEVWFKTATVSAGLVSGIRN